MPYLYDWLTNHNITWPSQCCRWGPQVGESSTKTKHRVYLSEQTDGSAPNKLVIGTADVVKIRVAAAESIASFRDNGPSRFFRITKTIEHPGEVNKIRELAEFPDVLLTHTDAADVYVWNIENQPAYKPNVLRDPTPDLVLKGHRDQAPFALGTSSAKGSSLVASGGRDAAVLLWDLADHRSSLCTAPSDAEDMEADGLGARGGGLAASPTLGCRAELKGHTSQIEEVVFKPGSTAELASVADDKALIFWDTRAGAGPATLVEDAHRDDVQCIDWSARDEHLVVTGSGDSSVHVWDLRRLSSSGRGGNRPLHSFHGHKGSILRVQWCPDAKDVFASGGDDTLLNVWDLGKVGNSLQGGGPDGLLFQHCGHRSSVVDFQWNAADPWTMLSISDDVNVGGGGTLQMWRMNDLIYRPEAEALRELEEHKDFILTGRESDQPMLA